MCSSIAQILEANIQLSNQAVVVHVITKLARSEASDIMAVGKCID